MGTQTTYERGSRQAAAEPPVRWPPPIYDPTAEVVLWPSRKCACTSLTEWFVGAGWEILDPRQPLPIPAASFTMIRDPVDRYVSSIHQAWVLGYFSEVPWETAVAGTAAYNSHRRKPWTAQGDEHFTRQTLTVARAAEHVEPTLFPFPNFEPIQDWLADLGARVPPGAAPHKQAGSALLDDRTWVFDQLDPEIIRAYYAGDVEIWETITDG